MLLEHKSAVIYGGGGSVGGAVARAFAREGAKVFLAGRTLARLAAVSDEISAAGGLAETAQVDALDAAAVDEHAARVVAKSGSMDISFNAVSFGAAQGASLVDMPHERFVLPIATAVQAHFLTGTVAARHMAKNGSGVILALTAQASRKPYVDVGGFGVACAAIEAFCRQLAAEAGPQGIRVVCLRSAGSPDTPGVAEAWSRHAQTAGMSPEMWEAQMAQKTLLRRLPKLHEVANVAVLMASDYANTMTGAIANVTCGEIVD